MYLVSAVPRTYLAPSATFLTTIVAPRVQYERQRRKHDRAAVLEAAGVCDIDDQFGSLQVARSDISLSQGYFYVAEASMRNDPLRLVLLFEG